jgi:DnaJ-class molecular chaperone
MSERDRNEYYALLGVTLDATPSQVEAAYKAALKATDGPGKEFARKAVEQAFTVLGDAASRAAYDSGSAASHRPQERHCEDDYLPRDSLPRTVVNHPRDPKGYYKLLRVPVDASQEEIIAAYRHIASSNPLDFPVTDRPMAAIQVAFNVLSEPMLRAAYDPVFLSSGTSTGAQNLRRVFRTFEPPFHAGIGPSASRTRIPDALLQEIPPSPSPQPQGCLGIVLLLITLFIFWAET